MNFKTFALDGRFGDPSRFSVAKMIKDELEKGGMSYSELCPDIVICIGGDGSLLKSLNSRGYEGNYLLINGGTLGYLGDYHTNEWEKAVFDLLSDKTPNFEEHIPLVCQDKSGHFFYAANDISMIAPVRAINFDLLIDNEKLLATQASGLIVCSPLGSTAFNLSVDGPVLLTGNSTYSFSLVAPICNKVTHTFIKHGVLNNTSTLKIRLEQNAKLYKFGGDGIENRTMYGHDFCFYPSTKRRFYIVRYKNHSLIKRMSDSFSTVKG